jgi:DEAD/DEAH box helicase domain-containing protein
MRFHLLYRNIPGMWGELIPDSETEENEPPIGQLVTSPEISHNGHRTLELLYCENCGILAFGGSRIQYNDEYGDPITELIPVSPDIEGVPEYSPATIVEKRKYKDFSVFCPGNYESIEPENNIKQSGGLRMTWCPAWLNVDTGKIITKENPQYQDKYIAGQWLRIMNGDQDIADIPENALAKRVSALPHVCPHCEADYSHPSKKKQSPFRGFRTGFGKVSQILSKEIFEALPDGENTKKLVAFSDSREDAAKLAKNIEEEHYFSLLREVIIHNITSELQLDLDIISAIEQNDETAIEEFNISHSDRFDELEYLINRSKKGRTAALNELNSLKENIKPIDTFANIIIKEFLKFGINPGGPFKSIENFKSDRKYHSWDYFFDFNTGEYDTSRAGWETVRDIIREKIEKNLSSFVFGRLFYSLEASGLGYATVEKNSDVKRLANQLRIPDEILIQISNSFMRIWGDNYKHNRTEYEITLYDSYERLPNGRKEKKYVKKVSQKLKIDENELGNAVIEILFNHRHRGVIEINNLKIKLANRKDEYYQCGNCKTIHLHHSGGTCVFCQENLHDITSGEVVDLWEKSYLTSNLLKDYKPFRLHTEELSGQTDNQLLRQRQFKNIILDPEDRLKQQIDLLSVTTTLEVGVDIGALQAIFQANMPPQRFNYQQRVGRTGRRNQLFSYALTFARGRSHDEYYFNYPLSITGDKPPQPFLSLDQARIFRRILAKAVLRFAFKDMGVSSGSVHGEFGSVENYNQELLQHTIDNNISGEINRIFNSLNVGIYKTDKLEKFNFDQFEPWIRNMPSDIRGKIDNQGLIIGDLADFLAESGILPMAGMPTRIKNLIHNFQELRENNIIQGYESLSIDRDLSMAIYEFAPAAQKTKDKGVIQAVGFTPDIQGIEFRRRRGQNTEIHPKIMHENAFTDRLWLIQDKDTKLIKSEPYRERINQETGIELTIEQIKENLENENPNCIVFVGASPSAFRTNFKYPKDSTEDFDFAMSKPLTFAETRNDPKKKPHNNCLLKYAEQELTWKINDNGGDFFQGRYYTQEKYGTLFPDQWIASDFIDQIYGLRPQDEDDEFIALASGKVTEVFRLEPTKINIGLEVNLFNSDLFKRAASKGALYSAAFLLQRTLADDLDIDPEEIEIAAISPTELPDWEGITDRKSASIVLADELPNGSGFIHQLYENFDKYIQKCINPTKKDKYNYSYITDNHRKKCKDACYHCLKNFRNMNFHALLDWRLGMGFLRLMDNEDYSSGLKTEDYEYPELIGWFHFTQDLAKNMASAFDNIEVTSFGKLNGFLIGGEYKVIIVHPFWNWSPRQPGETENIFTRAVAEAGLENLYFIDSFNLHRRPGMCYGKLVILT